MKKILALDISSSATGWAVIKSGRFYKKEGRDYGLIRLPSKIPHSEKLSIFRERLSELYLGISPDFVAIESVFAGPSIKTALLLSKYAGVAQESSFSLIGIDPVFIEVKKVRAALGVQGKENSFNYVKDKYSLADWEFKTHNDVADAVSVGLSVRKIYKGK